MKKLNSLTRHAVVALLFSIITTTAFAQASKALDWQLLVSGTNAGAFIACTPTNDGKASKLAFRHTFPGFTRIVLVVSSKANDGHNTRHIFTASGFNSRMYSNADNLVPADQISSTIEYITVQYMAYGVSYRLYIDATNGTRELTMDGKPYNYGPQYKLELQSLPVPPSPRQQNSLHPEQPVVTIH